MYFVYLLRCADGTLYCGYTTDLKRRLNAHNSGCSGAKYTRGRRPVELVYFDSFDTKGEALSREFSIKQLTREEKEKLIETRRKTPGFS